MSKEIYYIEELHYTTKNGVSMYSRTNYYLDTMEIRFFNPLVKIEKPRIYIPV